MAPSSDCEMNYSEEPTFYSTAVSNVRTALCVLTSENRLLTVNASHDLKKVGCLITVIKRSFAEK